MVICFEEMIEKTKISIICEAQDEYCVEACDRQREKFCIKYKVIVNSRQIKINS